MQRKLAREISYGRVSTSDPDSDPEFTSGAIFGADKSPKKARRSRSAVGPSTARRAKRTRRSEILDGAHPSEQRNKRHFIRPMLTITLQKQKNAIKARHRTHFWAISVGIR